MVDMPETTPANPADLQELLELTRQAQAGDSTALARIRSVLDEHPEVWEHAGDVSALAERAWIVVVAAENPLAVESMQRTISEMRAQLQGEHPTRLEQLLVDDVIACWLQQKYFATVSADPGHGSVRQGTLYLKQQDSAHRRYTASIKALATVRQLAPRGLAPGESLRLHDPKTA